MEIAQTHEVDFLVTLPPFCYIFFECINFLMSHQKGQYLQLQLLWSRMINF